MPFLDPPAEFFVEAVQSVLEQSYTDWELILINDGSGAAARAQAEDFSASHPESITLCEHSDGGNYGISASRNLGLNVASGEFVAFLDADDVWDENQLQEQLEIMRQHPEVGLMYGNTIYWRNWGDNAQADIGYKLGLIPDRVYEPPSVLQGILRRRAISPCMTSVLVRQSVFDDGVRFVEEFTGHYEDQVFLAQVFCRYPVYVSGRTWGKYRQHIGSTTGDGDDSPRARRWRQRYLEWLDGYVEGEGMSNSAVSRSLRLELWMFRNRHAERLIEWIRLWKHRGRKLTGRPRAR